jgi:hypothetical protein
MNIEDIILNEISQAKKKNIYIYIYYMIPLTWGTEQTCGNGKWDSGYQELGRERKGGYV